VAAKILASNWFNVKAQSPKKYWACPHFGLANLVPNQSGPNS